MNDLTILALSNKQPKEPYLFYDAFLASLRKFGFEPVIIDDSVGKYGGLGSRPRLIKAAIDQGKVPTAFVCWLDAWDLVAGRNPLEALKLFLEWPLNHKGQKPRLVAGCEKNIFPFPWYADLHPESPTSYRYLNSGGIIGETSALYDVLLEMKCEEIPDDHMGPDGKMVQPICQSFFQEQFINGSVPMALDYQCAIFQNYCMVDEAEMDFSEQNIRNVITGTEPIFLHANGEKQSPVVIRTLQHLGYR